MRQICRLVLELVSLIDYILFFSIRYKHDFCALDLIKKKKKTPILDHRNILFYFLFISNKIYIESGLARHLYLPYYIGAIGIIRHGIDSNSPADIFIMCGNVIETLKSY